MPQNLVAGLPLVESVLEERRARIQWALDSPQTALTSFLAEPSKTADGGTYTTVTMRKKNETTLRVLV